MRRGRRRWNNAPASLISEAISKGTKRAKKELNGSPAPYPEVSEAVGAR